jgi:peptide-methionine (R)-S-oxide reductase
MQDSDTESSTVVKLDTPKDAWRLLLSTEGCRVIVEEGTEPAFSSPLNTETRVGTFVCAACFLPLFKSTSKFNSGTGWPSFYSAIEDHVETKRDLKLVLPRIEYHCVRCGGHQGHVFSDGPQPTGQRYCNNGVALRFIPDGEPLPELRDGLGKG